MLVDVCTRRNLHSRLLIVTGCFHVVIAIGCFLIENKYSEPPLCT